LQCLYKKVLNMQITANNPNRKSWIEYDKNSDFPIQNIPFGIFSTQNSKKTIGTRMGDFVIDINALYKLNYFSKIDINEDVLNKETLNDFIALGRKKTREIRNQIAEIFDINNPELRDNSDDIEQILFPISDIKTYLPIQVGDYTDFYSSREHATNVGMMFRDPNNALLPNWLHIPVGYHGRSSTIVASEIPVRRPLGQTLPNGETLPVFGASKLVDFELEMAFITTDANKMGNYIPISEVEEHIFGLVLLNDWSARDIQKWEYVPLGPFLAKNFASSISTWIVTLDALEPFRCESPKQEDPKPLTYLQQDGNHAFDINLEVLLKPENSQEMSISKSNFRYMYWTMSQQLAHHTINGCKINAGDLMGSGTISGATPDSYGSMLELTWSGKNPLKMPDGTERKFIADNDTIIMKGYCQQNGIRIGFGEVSNKLLPAIEFEK